MAKVEFNCTNLYCLDRSSRHLLHEYNNNGNGNILEMGVEEECYDCGGTGEYDCYSDDDGNRSYVMVQEMLKTKRVKKKSAPIVMVREGCLF